MERALKGYRCLGGHVGRDQRCGVQGALVPLEQPRFDFNIVFRHYPVDYRTKEGKEGHVLAASSIM